jgi:hypothetical protein
MKRLFWLPSRIAFSIGWLVVLTAEKMLEPAAHGLSKATADLGWAGFIFGSLFMVGLTTTTLFVQMLRECLGNEGIGYIVLSSIIGYHFWHWTPILVLSLAILWAILQMVSNHGTAKRVDAARAAIEFRRNHRKPKKPRQFHVRKRKKPEKEKRAPSTL